ncbi:MAG: hypothetical protein SGJ20_08160, partial [Planctomycetota bacterium]|nr:hypothetical protein [Planctomycetota bacterium]
MPHRSKTLRASPSRTGPTDCKWEAALVLLGDAAHYAEEVSRDAWEFAVEIDSLLTAGLTRNDLRWLAYKGFVSHAVETTRPSARKKRTFVRRDTIIFSPRTCFVATAGGLKLAKRHLTASSASHSTAPFPAVAGDSRLNGPLAVPNWNPTSRTLHFGNVLIKEFKVPAANQELVLSAFEEESWPPHLDDPLPPATGLDTKRRLHHT